ncbi:SUKH-4 family immunity protein [Streptomyces sp. NPDC048057]|uniref:SUKH-4 family immunity protein n=1 Tax=Streptomyces sp. NPDC048057 TaxID=3155628 RepID=UPI0033D891FC
MFASHVVVPEHALHPSIVHEPTRRALTRRAGLHGHGLVSFHPLAAPVAPTVREHLIALGGDPEALDGELAELVLIGHLVVEGDPEGEEVVVDGSTGRVHSMWLYEKSPGTAEVFPLAPSVDALLRFLAAVDDFRGRRGRFAALAGRSGPEAVREAEALFTGVFDEEEWGEDGWGAAEPPSDGEHAIPALWRIAAVIRPLGLMAGAGDGLALDLPAGLLEDAFGADEVVRLSEAQLPSALVHGPTRRFLTEVGLPGDGIMFSGPAAEPLPVVAQDRAGDGPLPADAEHLIVLGGLVHDFEVLLDGRSGALFYAPFDSAEAVPVNTDVSTLAFTLWLHQCEQEANEEHDFTQDFYHPLADTMVEVLASVDPVACAPASDPDDFRYWPEVFHDEAGGVL